MSDEFYCADCGGAGACGTCHGRAAISRAYAELSRLRADPRPDRREAILRLAEVVHGQAADALQTQGTVPWSANSTVLRTIAKRLRSIADLPERAASRGTTEHETAIRCEVRSGPPGEERQCLRFTNHDARGHLFDDPEITALWNGLAYWHRKAKELALAALPPETAPVMAELYAEIEELLYGIALETDRARQEERFERDLVPATMDKIRALDAPASPPKAAPRYGHMQGFGPEWVARPTLYVAPCPECVSEVGHAVTGCSTCGGSGVCPSAASPPKGTPPTDAEVMREIGIIFAEVLGEKPRAPGPCAHCEHYFALSLWVGQCERDKSVRAKTASCAFFVRGTVPGGDK